MSETLSAVLASSYSLTIKSQVYHWNVVGPLFKPIHELTEEHYNDLFAAIDIIAERIRALGHLTPMHQTLISDMITTNEAGDEVTPEAMIHDLVSSHEKIVRQMRDATGKAGEASDVVTEDMLTERLNFHEQAIWMLRAIIAS
jgi:starvation-inducible DNA-binding protein